MGSVCHSVSSRSAGGGALIGELPGIGFIRAVEHQRRKHLKAGVEQHTVLNGEQDVVDGAIDPAR